MLAAVTVDSGNFEAMLGHACEFHEQVEALGMSCDRIRAHVHGRLHWHLAPELPPGQAKLADEILELLENPLLSPWQTHELEWAFFLGK